LGDITRREALAILFGSIAGTGLAILSNSSNLESIVNAAAAKAHKKAPVSKAPPAAKGDYTPCPPKPNGNADNGNGSNGNGNGSNGNSHVGNGNGEAISKYEKATLVQRVNALANHIKKGRIQD